MSSTTIDRLVVGQLFKAVEPAALELSLQVLADDQRERERLHLYWSNERERIRYEVDRAERQFQAIEPENRLVGRTLESKWEEALRKQHELEEAWHRFMQTTPQQLSDDERQRIATLSQDIKVLWNAEQTTNVDRKEIIRCLVERVVIHVRRDSEHVDVTIHWYEGFTSQHELLRPVNSYQRMANSSQLHQRIAELHQMGNSSLEIARQLNQEGFSPPRRANPFSKEQIWQLLKKLGLTKQRDALVLTPNEWELSALAKHLSVPILRLRYWASHGWINARQTPTHGLWIVWADDDEVNRLTQLAAISRHGMNKYPPKLITPKQIT